MAEKQFYVYALCRPTGEPFYVGKGKGGRVFCHESNARRGGEDPKSEFIRSLWNNGQDMHVRILFESDNEQEALAEEHTQILHYRPFGLVNSSQGWNLPGITRPRRLNVELEKDEEWILDELKILANEYKISFRNLVIFCLQQILTDIQNGTFKFLKKKGVQS